MTADIKITPVDSKLESSILQALINAPDAKWSVRDRCKVILGLKADWFHESRRPLVEYLQARARTGQVPNRRVLAAALRISTDVLPLDSAFGDFRRIHEVTAAIDSLRDSQGRPQFVKLLKDLNEMAVSYAQAQKDDKHAPFPIAEYTKLLSKASSSAREISTKINVTEIDVLSDDQLDDCINNTEGVLKYPTGWARVDELFDGGVEAKSVLMLSGNAKGAKTMFASSFFAQFIRRGIDTTYISLEVSGPDMRDRVLANLTNRDRGELRSKRYARTAQRREKADMRNLAVSYRAEDVERRIMDISGYEVNLTWLCDEIAKIDSGVVIVDHIGLIEHDPGDKRPDWEFRRGVIRSLHAAVQHTNVALIVLAQNTDEGTLSSSKQQTQSVTYQLNWMLGDAEREAKIVEIEPKNFRNGTSGIDALYFRLNWSAQRHEELSPTDPAVLDYIDLRSNTKSGKIKGSNKAPASYTEEL